MLQLFRAKIMDYVPAWLRSGEAEKLLYTLGLHMDALSHQAAEAIRHRFPNLEGSESLKYLGYDRKIIRGRTETDAVYSSRMQGWRQAHRMRGNAISLLRQVHAHYAPNNFPVELVYHTGKRFSMDIAGDIVIDYLTTGVDWGATEPTKWARWYMFYHWPVALPASNEWDAFLWDDGTCWDCSLDSVEVSDIRQIPESWNAAHANGKIILLNPGEDYLDYTWGLWPNQVSIY